MEIFIWIATVRSYTYRLAISRRRNADKYVFVLTGIESNLNASADITVKFMAAALLGSRSVEA
jgi:hypothetical protein